MEHPQPEATRPPAGAAPARQHVARLRAHLLDTLGDVLGEARECVLLDFPAHRNVGDSLIVLGELAALRALGVRVRRIADLRSIDPEDMAESLPTDVPVLMHGGGNLGDLYPQHQQFRERVLKALPHHRMVMLPQTAHFDDADVEAAAAATMGEHRDLTVLVRDHQSEVLVRERMGLQARLCPDSALALTGLRRPRPNTDVIAVWRTDGERRGRGGAPGDVRSVDWPLVDRPRVRRFQTGMARSAGRLADHSHLGGRMGEGCGRWSHEFLARRTAGRGLRAVRGRVLVTDRLHGHILALMLDIPHVLVDNSYGKLSGFTAQWKTHPEHLWAADRATAVEMARSLL